jgi:hypothetical protein
MVSLVALALTVVALLREASREFRWEKHEVAYANYLRDMLQHGLAMRLYTHRTHAYFPAFCSIPWTLLGTVLQFIEKANILPAACEFLQVDEHRFLSMAGMNFLIFWHFSLTRCGVGKLMLTCSVLVATVVFAEAFFGKKRNELIVVGAMCAVLLKCCWSLEETTGHFTVASLETLFCKVHF